MMERGEFAQIVDHARTDGNGNGTRTIEYVVQPLHIGPIGMEFLLFDQMAFTRHAGSLHISENGLACGIPCITVGDNYGFPSGKMFLKEYRSTMKQVLAKFECFRIGCDFQSFENTLIRIHHSLRVIK